ncbi:MAG: hypothetical protein ACFCUU_00505 [Cyclobacteriaceae bacterium]
MIICVCFCFSCKEKFVCPSYHTYFILDQNETLRHFSLFSQQDSLPKGDGYVAKTKFGIYDEPSFRKKEKEMKTVSMESIYKALSDPFEDIPDRNLLSKQQVDSLYMVHRNPQEEFYNVDQMIYLHHFGKYLPKPRAFEDELEEEEEEEVLIDEEPKEKKRKGLFGLGRKKNQEEEVEEEEEEENWDDIWP